MSLATAHDRLEEHYAALESRFEVTDDSSFAALVTANGNDRAPIHRWFRMKEAYSSNLLRHVLRETGLGDKRDLSIFDPFSGSGTTSVSAGDMVRDGTLQSARVKAVEVNPFLHLLSTAKVAGHVTRSKGLFGAAGAVARRAISASDGLAEVPALSTFRKTEYFPAANMTKLLALRASLDQARDHLDDHTHRFLQVALAAAIEPSSNLRRDGRALRLSPGKAVSEPIDVFLSVASKIAEDLPQRSVSFDATVELADVRSLERASRARTDDLSVFSPPYPNNIDYTEVYKMEGWLLGLYGSAAEVADQRRRTLRSHSSLKWGDEYRYRSRSDRSKIDELLEPVLAAIPDDRYRRGREEVVRGYVDDMLSTIEVVSDRLRGGGEMAIIVGNSMHGKQPDDYVIASDLLLARLAELNGFSVRSIIVSRYPKRRVARSKYLRESIVIAKRDQA